MNWLYAALLFFIGVGITFWVILTLMGVRRRRQRHLKNVEVALSTALCKIESGKISQNDIEWAQRVRSRMWGT